jgi:hypothetical protein
MEQELLTLPEHLSSPPVFSGVRVARSLVLCVCFVDRGLPFCPFSFGHCVVCSSSIYGFWLPVWYLQPLLANNAVFVLFYIWLAARVLVISIAHRRQLHLSYTTFKIDCYKRLRHPIIWQNHIRGYVQMNINVNNQSVSVSFVIQ